MTVDAAIQAVAASQALGDQALAAWNANAQQLRDLGADNDARIASIIGQCAHESGGFRYRSENLNYSADGLQRVFRKYFPSPADAADYARQPERIANKVYANRMGNGDEASGDGWRYRGRGFIQMTGRDNYRVFGKAVGLDLEGDPDKAAEPETAWLLAVQYFRTRKRSGKTLLEWADAGDERMVTLGINGGTNGLADRELRVSKALNAINGTTTVHEWQTILAEAGFDPGTIDGLIGPDTRAAMAAAEKAYGLKGEALARQLRAIA